MLLSTRPFIFLSLSFVAGCTGGEKSTGDKGDNPSVVQNLDVFSTATDTNDEVILGVVDGARATLVRTEDALTLDGQTNSLEAGAYTLWWIIINEPHCLGTTGDSTCDPDIAGLWATGLVVGEDGTTTFAAELGPDGPKGEVLYIPSLGLTSDGLHNPFSALIKIIFRWHGPASADPETLDAQLHTVNGMCAENFPEMSEETGAPFCPQPQLVVATAG